MKFSHPLGTQPPMKSDAPSRGTTTTSVARVPYLNAAPFFRGLALGDRFSLTDLVPREQGAQAAAGALAAGLIPLVDFFRLEQTFERVGRFGIAVRGRARSVLLFSRKPIRQLDGAEIAVTEESSTSAILLRLILEQRYELSPARYDRVRVPRASGVDEGNAETREREAQRGRQPDADALLLIGDAALRFQQSDLQYPYETDLAFEWWLWQHVPFVFAVWAIRKDASPYDKKHLELSLSRSLGVNMSQLEAIAEESSKTLGLPAASLSMYLSGFAYRFGEQEEAGITRFQELVNEHHLL